MKIDAKSSILALLAIMVLLAAAPDPAQARKKKEEPIESYRARVFDTINPGMSSTLDIVIYEWTTEDEWQALLKAFLDGGSDALYDALQDAETKGFFRLPGTVRDDIQYAWQVEVEGKRRIVLATDHPVRFIELSLERPGNDYKVSLVVLDLDPETGQGDGTAGGGVDLSIDQKTGHIVIHHARTQPARITNVKKLGSKKKKGE